MEHVEDFDRRMTETFSPGPQFVSRARRSVGAFLADDVPDDVVEVALLLVSELATNSVSHAGSDFTVTAVLLAESLTVAVEDGSARLPEVQDPAPSASGGRGMFLVEALSSRWGAEPTTDGKRVWFELGLG